MLRPAYGASPEDFAKAFETSLRGTVGLATFTQDQTTDSLDVPFLQELNTATLDGAAVRDGLNRTFNVQAGEGVKFAVGNIVELANNEIFQQSRVLSIATDAITLDDPIVHAFADNSIATISTDDLLVDGSGTHQIFKVKPNPSQGGDITRVILRMEATAVMDSGTFGPIASPGLSVGVLIRRKKTNGDYRNIINFKTNGDFIAKSFDHNFLPNNGNGVRLFVCRLTWAGQSKFGVVQRIEGDLNEELECVIMGDLSKTTTASWVKFTLALQGHELQESL